ncbi:MAG: nucleotidyltransferase family protein [Pseudoxanthomonas sp.]
MFGSVLHGEDTEDSDLDLLVDPIEGTSLFDLGGIVYELRQLLGVRVDLFTPRALPPSFRDEVIAEASPV